MAANTASPNVKIETSMETDTKPVVNNTPSNNVGNPNNSNMSDRGGRGRRRRGGVGPFRGGGGRHDGMGHPGGRGSFDKRPFSRPMLSDFDGPQNKRAKVGGPEGRILERLRSIQGPTADLPPKPFETRKFAANTRLYIGNIAPDASEEEIKSLFTAYGEIDELFLNREKNFAFLKLDFRTSAEKARGELDQKNVKGRPLKVRFAPANVRLKVKNLSSMVSNELLEMAFSIFGDIEKALVFVDDKGKSLGEGIVDFTRKNNAQQAHKFCQEKCYFITGDLRPVITEVGEMYEMDEGFLESNLPKREYNKNRELVYYKARELGPRIADHGSFEHDYGMKWKSLVDEFKLKEKALKEELDNEAEKLQQKMEMAKYEYETELLRQQLRQREQDQQRHKQEWDQKLQRGSGGGGGFNSGPQMGLMGAGPRGGGDLSMSGGGGGGLGMRDQEQMDNDTDGGSLCFDNNGTSLAPPPLGPQGLMSLQNDEDRSMNGVPTWEISPFGPGQMAGSNFGGPPCFRNNDRDGGQMMGGRGGGHPRGGPHMRGRGFRGRGGRR